MAPFWQTRRLLSAFKSLGATLAILLIRGYQSFISPFLGPHCRFTPSCSQYGLIAIKRFGLIKGGWLTLKRVLKCHPLHEGGDDPVPPKNEPCIHDRTTHENITIENHRDKH